MNLINGRLLADKIKDAVAKEVFDLCANPANIKLCARRPSLAIILIGAQADSELYVNLKQKTAGTVGIDTHLYKFADTVTETEIIDTINFLNTDNTVDGILIQLPLPANFDTDKIISLINPSKDVDGFSAVSLSKLTQGEIISPVFQSVLACLEDVKFDLKDKQVAIVAKPGIFTDSLDKLLEHLGATVTSIEPKDVGIATAEADLLITAVGQADLINGDDIKDGAVIIDIGISQNETGKTCGDVDEASVASIASWLTPVPGGIGPMTIAFALKNTLNFFKKNLKK
jgi:methylenetetrahydrofolate dehydrogenase (NADP+)/methenyltetrahydrofolate cyclohydrolase